MLGLEEVGADLAGLWLQPRSASGNYVLKFLMP